MAPRAPTSARTPSTGRPTRWDAARMLARDMCTRECECWYTSHTFRGPIQMSTHGPSGRWPPFATPLFRHTTHACRSPMGSSTENLVAAVACRHPIILAHFSHVSRTHGEHHRRPPSGHGRLGAPPKVQVAAVSSTTEPQWPLSHGATS